MIRRSRLAAGGLALTLVAAGVLWAARRAPDAEIGPGDPSEQSRDAAPAPPPPLASPGLDRHAAIAKAPRDVRPPGPGSAPTDGRFRGQVLDPDGRPVAGALVREIGAVEPAPTATTDGEGRFDLLSTAKPPGGLRIAAPGFAETVVAAGAVTAGPAIALDRGWTISGVVRDVDSDEPVVATSVSASPAASPQAVDPPRTRTDADGAFRLVVAEAGAYVLDVGTRFVGGAPTASDDWVPTQVEGVAAGTSGLRVPLARGRSIEGEIVDDRGERVTRRVRVDAVKRTATGDADYTTRKIVAADAGGLRVPGLSPGRYDLHVKPEPDPADGGATPFSETIVRDIAAGTRGLVVRLFRGFVLVGRLEDGAGAPILGSGRLYAYRAGERARSHPVFGQVPGDGTFRVGPLDESYRYDLLATEFEGRQAATRKDVAPRDANVVVVLEAGKAIAGRVEAEDGKPVPAGVPVGVVAEGLDPGASGSRAFAYTRVDGSFVADGLPEAPFMLEAGGGRSGYLGTVVRGVRPGRTDVVLRVSVGVDLSGTLVDEQGEPVATTSLGADDGARLAAMRPFAQVGADGRFVLRGLRAGPVRLTARLGDAFIDLGTLAAPATDAKVVVPPR